MHIYIFQKKRFPSIKHIHSEAGLDFLVNQGCEAIVVHASRLPDKELLRYAAHFPALVVVNRYIAGMANRCIWLENRSAAREATRYLLANFIRR